MNFKWSVENIEAGTDHGFPTVYVEMDDTTSPGEDLPTGSFFERRLLELPVLEEAELGSRFGITGFSNVLITADNSDGLLNDKDLQDSYVKIWFVDESGNIYKQFNGRVTEWTLSHRCIIVVEDIDAIAITQQLPKRTLNDLIEAEKSADSGFSSAVVANDLGKSIPIIFGRAVKVPLLHVKSDDTLREYDYIIGEGKGLNDKYFQSVFTVYKQDRALDSIEGTASGADTDSLTLETADRRPDGWYRHWWVEITSGTGKGQIRDVTDYESDSNKITISSAWTAAPDTTSEYRLREWRFYDGSQSSPYAGYAFVRLKKRLATGGRSESYYADVNGLGDETNVVRAVQSVLTNSDWGLGLSVDTDSFDTASGLSEIQTMKCEGVLLNTVNAVDLLKELLSFRDMVLSKDGSIKIGVDQAKTASLSFGLGDEGGRNNIADQSPEIFHLPLNERVKNLKVKYRKNHRENSVYLHEIEKESSSKGVDQTVEAPFIYAHETADRILDYKTKRLANAVKKLTLNVGQEGADADRGDLVSVDIPSLEINSDWEVTGASHTIAGLQKLVLVPYSSDPYTYQSGTLPVDESFDVAPDYFSTPPDPVANLSVATGLVTDANSGEIRAYFDLTWDPPESNYLESKVRFKFTDETLYSDAGRGKEGLRFFVPATAVQYDILVIPLNIDGSVEGTPTTTTQRAGADFPTPSSVGTVTISVTHRTFTGAVDFQAEADSSHILFELLNDDDTVDQAKTVSISADQNKYNVSFTVGGTGQESRRIRARQYNTAGRAGEASTSVSAVTAKIPEEDTEIALPDLVIPPAHSDLDFIFDLNEGENGRLYRYNQDALNAPSSNPGTMVMAQNTQIARDIVTNKSYRRTLTSSYSGTWGIKYTPDAEELPSIDDYNEIADRQIAKFTGGIVARHGDYYMRIENNNWYFATRKGVWSEANPSQYASDVSPFYEENDVNKFQDYKFRIVRNTSSNTPSASQISNYSIMVRGDGQFGEGEQKLYRQDGDAFSRTATHSRTFSAVARFYVVNETDLSIDAYDPEGHYQPQLGFSLDPGNSYPGGISIRNNKYYVVDTGADDTDAGRVFVYDSDGSYLSGESFDLDSDNVSPSGVGLSGTRIYTADRVADRVFAYDYDGNYQSSESFDLSSDNAESDGMAVTLTKLYTVDLPLDLSGAKVYVYNFPSGTFDYSFDLHTDNKYPAGIAASSEGLYVVNQDRDQADNSLKLDRVFLYGYGGSYKASAGFNVSQGKIHAGLAYNEIEALWTEITIPDASILANKLAVGIIHANHMSAGSIDLESATVRGTLSARHINADVINSEMFWKEGDTITATGYRYFDGRGTRLGWFYYQNPIYRYSLRFPQDTGTLKSIFSLKDYFICLLWIGAYENAAQFVPINVSRIPELPDIPSEVQGGLNSAGAAQLPGGVDVIELRTAGIKMWRDSDWKFLFFQHPSGSYIESTFDPNPSGHGTIPDLPERFSVEMIASFGK